MSPLPFGIVASSAAGFEASGGTFTVDANGYRHHIFNSSATLTVSGEKPVFILVQNGGNNGQNTTYGNDYEAVGNSGGAGGGVSYLQGTASSNITVTVAGAGGTGSVSGVSTSQWQTPVSSPAGGNRWYRGYSYDYYYGAAFWTGSFQQGTAASSGVAHSSKSSIYTGVTNLPTTSGGGGGAGGFEANGNSGSTAQPTSGGTQGGGTGGANSQGNGNSGTANTGGGGGGGAVRYSTYATSPIFNGAGGAGSGGSGYVVISYQLS